MFSMFPWKRLQVILPKVFIIVCIPFSTHDSYLVLTNWLLSMYHPLDISYVYLSDTVRKQWWGSPNGKLYFDKPKESDWRILVLRESYSHRISYHSSWLKNTGQFLFHLISCDWHTGQNKPTSKMAPTTAVQAKRSEAMSSHVSTHRHLWSVISAPH